jgi:hypothetical protein
MESDKKTTSDRTFVSISDHLKMQRPEYPYK